MKQFVSIITLTTLVLSRPLWAQAPVCKPTADGRSVRTVCKDPSPRWLHRPSGSKSVHSCDVGAGNVLIIANATADRNKDGDWTLPTPSAFTTDEIEAVHQW